jgi:hypothetical protein
MFDDPCSSATLLGLLKGGDAGSVPLPEVVVLNACFTGAPGERREGYMGFAAELVVGGVPVAIGMTGEVADAACREFTRACYQALITGKSIPAATAGARLAAMLQYGDFRTDVDWGRPVLYMAQGVAPSFQVDHARQALVVASSRYRTQDASEVLCDRLGAMAAYQDLRRHACRDGDHVVLSIEDSREQDAAGTAAGSLVYRVGKTLLLQEIASRAVFDGLIPCLLSFHRQNNPPPNLLAFAMTLAERLDEVRDYYGLAPSIRSRAYEVAFGMLGMPAHFDPDDVGSYQSRKADAYDGVFEDSSLVDPKEGRRRLILDAIKTDLEGLLRDVRTRVPEADRTLILVDNLHELEDLAPILIRCVTEWGLGGRAAPAPLIVSYVTRGEIGAKIQEEIKKKSKFFRRETLQPFRERVESRLAYTQFLLTRDPPYVINARGEKKDKVEEYFGEIHRAIRGIPYYLYQREMELCIRFGVAFEILVRAKP